MEAATTYDPLFGAMFRLARRDANIGLFDLAERADVSLVDLTSLEQDGIAPNATIRRVAAALYR